MKVILFTALMFFQGNIWAQDFGKAYEGANLQSEQAITKYKNSSKTIEIIYPAGYNKQFLISKDVSKQIEESRAESKDVTLNIENGIRIIVFSRKRIQSQSN